MMVNSTRGATILTANLEMAAKVCHRPQCSLVMQLAGEHVSMQYTTGIATYIATYSHAMPLGHILFCQAGINL